MIGQISIISLVVPRDLRTFQRKQKPRGQMLETPKPRKAKIAQGHNSAKSKLRKTKIA
jgi:hypothetical protein